jgi:hypothetical protein
MELALTEADVRKAVEERREKTDGRVRDAMALLPPNYFAWMLENWTLDNLSVLNIYKSAKRQQNDALVSYILERYEISETWLEPETLQDSCHGTCRVGVGTINWSISKK